MADDESGKEAEPIVLQTSDGRFFKIPVSALEDFSMSSEDVESELKKRGMTPAPAGGQAPVPGSFVRAAPSGMVRAAPSGMVRAAPSGMVRAAPGVTFVPFTGYR
ncbi:hypothetical protein JM93_01029 [Roseibium hamelinense]|uniref:Uncharacterized protein n=1 Tax=Roseibium hamelinense TaxID=150831 RepID=A0A562T9U1_9HYPH|nr:hypothetical protein [Roseibium hamelinense]TWI90053.1 hypothetical protein JM93_01029 [Roseibium hamelinense]